MAIKSLLELMLLDVLKTGICSLVCGGGDGGGGVLRSQGRSGCPGTGLRGGHDRHC